MLLCKLAISQKIETGSTCSCWCSWVFLGPRATRRLHFSQHWILNLERRLSEPQGSSAGINTSMAMREGLVPQLARFSDPEGPFPTSVWAAAMLTISLLHTYYDCNALSLRLYSFTFPVRDVVLPSLGRPQLKQPPVIIWWCLSAILLHKSVLTALKIKSRWP